MRRYAVPAGITGVVVLFLIVLVVGLSNAAPSNEIGSQVMAGHTPPEQEAQLQLPLITQSGKQSLSDYRGRYVLVNFFAGWCADCQSEVSSVHLAEKMLKPRGGTVLGVSWTDPSPDALAFMRRNKLDYKAVSDSNKTLANAYGVNGVPESFLIDPQGRVVAARLCPMTSGWVIKTFDRVLDEHKSAVGAQVAACAPNSTQSS